MAKKEVNPSEDSIVSTVDNEVQPEVKNPDVYIAWCDFTTWGKRKDETKGNMQITKGDEVTVAIVPQAWIDMAVSQHFLILKKDKENLSNDDLRKRGYSVH